MRRLTALTLAAALLAFSTAALAASTGNELFQACTNYATERPVTADMFNQRICAGIIQGAADMAAFHGEVCFPQGSTLDRTLKWS